MNALYEKELETAKRLAREAGELILKVASTSFGFEEKPDDGGPVTEADLLANDHIVKGLREAFPEDGVVAEESGFGADATRDRCWYVDPLDGTREFIKGNGQFAVHIGLAVGGEAKVGVVYRPVGDRLHAGVVGGACVLEEGGEARQVTVAEPDPEALTIAVSLSHPSKRIRRVRERLAVREVLRSGSVGLKCAMVAEGIADLYVHASKKSYRWDACAPDALVRAAGGLFLDMAGNPYRYGEGEQQNLRGILVCSPALLPSVLPAVREVAESADLI